MPIAVKGDKVLVKFTGKLADNSIFASSGSDGMSIVVGEEKFLESFEESIVGMSEGQTINVDVKHDKAFGPWDEDKIIALGKEDLPGNINPTIGMTLNLDSKNGEILEYLVTDINENKVTLDANHPLAGKDLNFEITLVKIQNG